MSGTGRSSSRITAAVVGEQYGTFELEDVLLAEPGEGEVLVRVAATGICPTDSSICHTNSSIRHGDLPSGTVTSHPAR